MNVSNEIIVTVCVLAYNHKNYIEKCLDSILCQKTEFQIEVLVHDDHSIDGTREIIEGYAKKYPDMIIPILQEENQYCKYGIPGLYREILYPMAKGKYIAYCEGDDYWNSPDKLARQVAIMEEHLECGMCLHYTSCVEENGNPMDWGYPQKKIPTGVMSGYDFMKGLTDGYFYHTTSFLCRADIIREIMKQTPEYYLESDVDDVPLLLYMGQHGDVYYLDEELTCYRRESNGSWTSGQKGNVEKIISHKERMIRLYVKYDKFTSGKYHDLTEHWINNERFMIAEWQHDFKEMGKKQYKEFLVNRSLNFKLKVFLAGILGR